MSTARATISGVIELRTDSEALVARLRSKLSRSHPVRGYKGRVEAMETVCLVSERSPVGPTTDGVVVLPRGAHAAIRRVADALGIEVEWHSEVRGHADFRALPPKRLGVELREYQRAGVDDMLRRVQCLVDLPCGCLSGDSEIIVNRAGKGFRITLSELVRRFNGGVASGKVWDPAIQTRAQCHNGDGSLVSNTIVNAWSTGEKEVFKIVVDSGRSLLATADHRFETPDGWARLSELKPGATVLVSEKPVAGPKQKTRSYRMISGMFSHPYANRVTDMRGWTRQTAVCPEHRLVIEAEQNGLGYNEFVDRIRAKNTDGLVFLDPSLWHVHHKDRNRRNNARSNLEVLTVAEHAAEHAKDFARNVLWRAKPAIVMSIESAGFRETFDLEMADPHHNYVANGFVVHNSGKTTLGAAAVVQLGLPALVIAPTGEILDQWEETLDRMGSGRVIRVGRGLPGPGEVAIGTPSAVAAHPAVLGSVGVLCADEAHRTPSKVLSELVAQCPARYRWGLTATRSRSDGREWVLPYVFGDVVVPATARELIDAGWLVRPDVIPVATGWRPSPEVWHERATCHRCGAVDSWPPSAWAARRVECAARVEVEIDGRTTRKRCGAKLSIADCLGERDPIDWSAATAELVASAERHATLVELAGAASDADRTVLVLVGSVALAQSVAQRLRDIGHDAQAVSGEDGKRARRAAVEDLRARRISILVATKLADEGLDVPVIDVVVIAEPGRATGRALQRAGRSMRPREGKRTPLVFVLVDDAPEYESQWRSVRNAYGDTYGRDAIVSLHPVPLAEALAASGLRVAG